MRAGYPALRLVANTFAPTRSDSSIKARWQLDSRTVTDLPALPQQPHRHDGSCQHRPQPQALPYCCQDYGVGWIAQLSVLVATELPKFTPRSISA